MKKSHAIISDHVFRGRRSGHINTITNLIYNAKFFNQKAAFVKLCRLCVGDIKKGTFDIIVPVQTRDSRYNLPARMAKEIGRQLNIKYLDCLTKSNDKCLINLTSYKVLVFDDVIYTGGTIEKATNAISIAGAKSVTGFAIARSRNYQSEKLT